MIGKNKVVLCPNVREWWQIDDRIVNRFWPFDFWHWSKVLFISVFRYALCGSHKKDRQDSEGEVWLRWECSERVISRWKLSLASGQSGGCDSGRNGEYGEG